MSLREKIVNWLLKEDEVITKKTEHVESLTKTQQPKTHPKRKRKNVCPIIWGGGDVSKGVIKQRDDGLWAYWYDGGRPHQVKGEYEDLKSKLLLFRKVGCTSENWKSILNKQHTHKPTDDRYIMKNSHRTGYILRKRIGNKNINFGVYSSKEKARTIRDYLEYLNWDLDYHPSKICKKNRVSVDEYYLSMLPIIYGDNYYAKYQGNNGG